MYCHSYMWMVTLGVYTYSCNFTHAQLGNLFVPLATLAHTCSVCKCSSSWSCKACVCSPCSSWDSALTLATRTPPRVVCLWFSRHTLALVSDPAACSLPYSRYLRPVVQCMLTDVGDLGGGPSTDVNSVSGGGHGTCCHRAILPPNHFARHHQCEWPPSPPPPPSSPRHDQLTQILCGWQTTVPFFTSPCTWGYTPGQTRHSYMY